MYLFTLHNEPKEFRIVSARVGETPRQAAKAWGGKFIPRPGGMATSSTDPDELGICGTVRFGSELFREMDDTDVALAGGLPGNVVYTKHNIALLAQCGETVELTLRQTSLASDDPPQAKQEASHLLLSTPASATSVSMAELHDDIPLRRDHLRGQNR